MKKDVIYIDIEDDITAVIEKLKNSKEKIIALVPPKGNAVLQSVVNLKLLQRAANQASKQPVIVTSNHALTALAGGLNLYVAKNLQSKPVLASELADIAPDDDIVVNDSAESEAPTTIPLNDNTADNGEDSDEVELSGDELASLEAENTVPNDAPAKKTKEKKNKALPNFDAFRKKLLLAVGGVVLLLIALLFLFGRTKASITVRAETTPVDVAFNAKFNADSQTSDPESYNLKAIAQQSKKSLSQSFNATGQKDIGQKAAGTVKFSTGSISALNTTIPAGTQLTASSGLVFVTTESVTITLSNYNNAPAGISAAESGTKYNGASGSLSGAPSGISATISKSPNGGTSQIVQVVTQADVDKAKDALNQQDTNQVKSELKKNFASDVYILDDSFTTTLGTVTSEPAVGQQANEGKLTVEATYSILGVSKRDLGSALDAFISTKMTNKDQQRVYDNGLGNIKLEKIDANDKVANFKVATTAQYGPQFDTENLKEQVAGKKYGEARSYLQGLPGVKGIDMSLTPFWARSLPGAGRITIKLDVDKNTLSQ